MKGIRTFATQAQALQYFVNVVINAANRGWFDTDEVKNLFRQEVDKWDSKTDFLVKEFWGLICLPILNFFAGVVEGGDGSMRCDFQWDVKKPGKGKEHLTGSCAWYGTATQGRFVRIIFTEDGGAKMFYDTGYRWDDEKSEEVAKGASSFLGLPAAGDETFSAMDRSEFSRLAHPEANN